MARKREPEVFCFAFKAAFLGKYSDHLIEPNKLKDSRNAFSSDFVETKYNGCILQKAERERTLELLMMILIWRQKNIV